jgi:hypothetical protein
MPMPRRERKIPTTIRLPESLYYELRVLMADPRTGAIKYDTWGPFFERIAREWISAQKVHSS